MVERAVRREAAIEAMADFLLREGMEAARLRSLAAAAGTSDRMLLYYFTDTGEAVAAALERLAARLPPLLSAALPPEARLPPGALLRRVFELMTSPALRPLTLLWNEMAAGAGRHRQPHRAVATGIGDGYVAWLMGHLAIEDASERSGMAALLLATIDGLLLLEAVGRRDLAEVALGHFERSLGLG
jgi:AcrR family transcriptional regulator